MRRKYVRALADEFTRSTEFTANGRKIEVGTELSFTGVPGRFRFVEHASSEDGREWVTVIGGKKGMKLCRSFPIEKIKTVHYRPKLR
jgi:hypothetical protein